MNERTKLAGLVKQLRRQTRLGDEELKATLRALSPEDRDFLAGIGERLEAAGFTEANADAAQGLLSVDDLSWLEAIQSQIEGLAR